MEKWGLAGARRRLLTTRILPDRTRTPAQPTRTQSTTTTHRLTQEGGTLLPSSLPAAEIQLQITPTNTSSTFPLSPAQVAARARQRPASRARPTREVWSPPPSR